MSRDKQIEEMANAYYEAMLKARGTLCSMNEGAPKWYAKELYAKGYRKASDIAEEIFAEIESVLLDKDSPLTVWCAINGQKYAELKKKYTMTDTNATTNTEEGK